MNENIINNNAKKNKITDLNLKINIIYYEEFIPKSD